MHDKYDMDLNRLALYRINTCWNEPHANLKKQYNSKLIDHKLDCGGYKMFTRKQIAAYVP